MSHYRTALPQLGHELFLTDGGLETTLVFLDRMELPCFAAFDLLRRPEGVQRLWDYYRSYADLARRWGVGLILESPTWRANPDWGQRLGCDARKLAELNQASVALMAQVRSEFESAGGRAVVSGCVGPRGDGYVLQQAMSVDEAAAYHSEQVAALADSPADLVTAATMTSSAEAAGVARATARFNIPVVLSFTVETDGRLPSGETLRSAIETVDELTAGAPAYYMVNCAHPEHFGPVLEPGSAWTGRLRGLRANASRRSHAELDSATDLDRGEPAAWAEAQAQLLRNMPHVTVLGGCCGTDQEHVAALIAACHSLFPGQPGSLSTG